MKKIISIAAAAAMISSFAVPVMAEDKTPSVYVNTSEIMFDDQTPVILGEGTTLVPARGVFEAMGADVQWDGENRLVEVESGDHKTIIRLTIDDSDMKVYDRSDMISTLFSGQDFQAPETIVTLDVAPQILNDRTMIPLRAISEAMGADVKWNGADYTINITTADAPASKEGFTGYYLTSSAETVEAGENVDIYVNVQNMPENMFVSGVTAVVKYDKANFEFVDSSLMNGENAIDSALNSANPDFEDGYVKAVYVTINDETAAKADGAVLKLTFKSLNGEEGAFALSNGYQTRVGYNTTLLVDPLNEETGASKLFQGDNFFVSSDAVVINAAN